MLLNILVIAALIALDQATKYLATMYLAPVGSMPLFPGVMELQYYLNDGAAFSILSGVEGGQLILLTVTGVVLAAMTVHRSAVFMLFFYLIANWKPGPRQWIGVGVPALVA